MCPTDSVAPLAAFWLEGVALPSVGGLGLVGNVATIIVLRYQSHMDEDGDSDESGKESLKMKTVKLRNLSCLLCKHSEM